MQYMNSKISIETYLVCYYYLVQLGLNLEYERMMFNILPAMSVNRIQHNVGR